MMDYLQSLKYEDFPDYAKIRKQLQAVGESSLVSENSDSGDEESSADRKEAQAVAAVSEVDWSAIDSERERALVWAGKAEEQKNSDGASDLLLTIAKRYNTFFDTEGLSFNERVWVQGAVYRIERSRARSQAFSLLRPFRVLLNAANPSRRCVRMHYGSDASVIFKCASLWSFRMSNEWQWQLLPKGLARLCAGSLVGREHQNCRMA